MAFLDWIADRFDRGRGLDELARRLNLTEAELVRVEPVCRRFSIDKRSGGRRWIQAPDRELKSIQRTILKRLLAALSVHPAAKGFEPGESIVTNARHHVGKKIVLRMDLEEFFPSTRSDRLLKYFRRLGWSRKASRKLTELYTSEGGLPQGAPTSPRLSNLVNYRLDARLAGLARSLGAEYTRYADELTFSFDRDDARKARSVSLLTKRIVRDFGYRLHLHKKLRIRCSHQRQIVTGLIVNDRVHLPRKTRRWLRAVEHRAATGGTPTISQSQIAGWKALRQMVDRQSVVDGPSR